MKAEMKTPKCPCGSNDFEVAIDKVFNAKGKVQLVVCSECGLVYGAVNNLDILELFKQQNQLLAQLGKKLDDHIAKNP